LNKPIVVDLDGTLIKTDMLFETFVSALKSNILIIFLIPLWLFKGKASLKQELAKRASVDVEVLPYNMDLLVWLRGEKNAGKTLILCTASDSMVANQISDHLGIFDHTFASDGVDNLASSSKAKKLVDIYGSRGFDYVGNSNDDLEVWKYSANIVQVNVSRSLQRRVTELGNPNTLFSYKTLSFKDILKACRPHQWIKNILIFAPILTASHITIADIQIAIFGFAAFSLCASAIYIINDLTDLNSDRHHPHKQFRPFASGNLAIVHGLALAPFLITVGLFIGFHVGTGFLAALGVYLLATTVYTFSLKSIVIVDCFCLGALYTIRVFAGALAVHVPLSFWFLAFSFFIFLSLAFLKRHAEIIEVQSTTMGTIRGRGYIASDKPLVEIFGICSGFIGVLILALYINTQKVMESYVFAEFLWLSVTLVLLWICRIWMISHRGKMHHDPIVFAVRDKGSVFIGLLFLSIFAVARIGIE
jgi:4-hydroxybenzoate polyprenyltransferase